MTDVAYELQFIGHPFRKLLTSSSSPTYPSNYKDLLISDPRQFLVVFLLSTLNLKILVQALSICLGNKNVWNEKH